MSEIFVFQFNPYSLISASTYISLLFLIWRTSRIQYRSIATNWFIIFLLSLWLWAVSEFLTRVSATPSGWVFWDAVGSPGWTTMPAFLFLFIIYYVGKEDLFRRLSNIIFLFAPVIVFLFFDWRTNLLTNRDLGSIISVPWGYTWPDTVLLNAYAFWITTIFTVCLTLLVQYYRQVQDKLLKKQTQLITLAIVIPIISEVFFDLALPLLGIRLVPLTSPTITLTAGVTVYAITKYNLFSVNPATIATNIVKTMNEALIVLDSSQLIKYVNQKATELFGYTQYQLIGQRITRLMPEKTRYKHFLTEVINPIKGNREVTGSENVIATAKGQEIEVNFSGSGFKDLSGHLAGFILALADIRELKKKTKQLEESHKALTKAYHEVAASQAKTEAILKGIGEGIIAVDTELKIIIVNRPAVSMLGVTEYELIDRTFSDVIAMVDGKNRPVAFHRNPVYMALIKMKIIATDKYFLVRKDTKTVFPVFVTASPVLLNGKIQGAIIVYRDITREKQIDRAKSEFVSLASHQLRTPLTSISWYTEMLLGKGIGMLNREQREMMKSVYEINRKMVEIVDTLLNVSRIELGTFAVQPKIINYKAIADDVIGELQSMIVQKQIHVVCQQKKDTPRVPVDPKLIRVIFQNLISNAVKYSPNERKVEIYIAKITQDVTKIKSMHGGILITVADHGYGIPEGEQGQIFTKMYRGKNVQEQEGTGLGLYIVQSIVDQTGGKIWFESEIDQGTTFYVAFGAKGMKTRSSTKQLS